MSRLEETAATSTTARDWHRAGVAALYGEDADRAVPWLERAVAANAPGGDAAPLWNDLAVARLARARAGGGDADLLRALDAAAAAGPAGDEVAQQAQRLLDLPAPDAMPREQHIAMLAARESLASGVDLTNSDEVTEVIERHWLPHWADAVVAGDAVAARSWAARADAAAEAVRAAGGDTSVPVLVRELTSASPGMSARAQGWLAYLTASTAFETDEMTRAANAAREMMRQLAAAGPVAMSRAMFLQAALDRVAGGVTAAMRTIEDGRAPVFRAYPVLEARRQAWIGLRLIERGRPGEGERALDAAIRTFAATGTAEAESLALNSMTRRAADRQEWDRAVRYQRRANGLLGRSARLRRDLVRRTGAFLASAMGLRHAALVIRGPAVAEARSAGASARLAFMLADEAVDHHLSGDVAAALASLDDAERHAGLVADAGLRDMIAVLHRRTRANVVADADPAQAAALYDDVVRMYRRRGSEFDTADVLLRRGRLLSRLGRTGEAETAWRDGLAVARIEVASHLAPAAAARLREARWALARELAALLVARDDRWGAYAVVEQARALAPPGEGGATTVVPPATLRVSLALLGERLTVFARWPEGRLSYDVSLDLASVQRLVESIREEARGGRSASTAGAPLADALFGPLRSPLSRASHITICADDALVTLPYAVLPDPDGGRLVDRRVVVLAPACDVSPRRQVTADAGVPLIAGAPDRVAADDAPDLPRAREEARAVAALHSGAAALLGAEVTRQTLLARLPGAPLFHFAGHAVAHPSRGDLSRLLVTPTADDPQGVLAAGDIESLRLASPLVVLAACETAAGAPAPGAGVVGLARSFLTAGAHTVIATHWPVPDDEAARFFAEIHRRLAVSSSAADAVAATQRWADRQGISAAVWAAVVVFER